MHHAAQAVAAFGDSLLPKASDDSQSSMNWNSEINALCSQEVNLKRRVRIALAYHSFKLHMINADDTSMGSFPISGQTKTTALSFVRMQARSMGKSAEEVQPISSFELPDSPYNQGAPFLIKDLNELKEMAKYRHNATELLKAIAAKYEHATPVATWPHHFDTGSVINVSFDDIGEPTSTVGIGMAVEDSACGEPYYYVNHWSKDKKISYDSLPELTEGARWETGNFKGAILPMSVVVKAKTAEEQCQMVEKFLQEAIDASIQLIDAEPVKA